jgi:predicted GNAT family acetyltransferase
MSLLDDYLDQQDAEAAAGESVASLLSGAVAQPVAGYAGLLAGAQGYDPAGAVSSVQNDLTYEPRTAAGQAALAHLASGINDIKNAFPVDDQTKQAWDWYSQANPLLAAAMVAAPNAIPGVGEEEAVGGAVARSAERGLLDAGETGAREITRSAPHEIPNPDEHVQAAPDNATVYSSPEGGQAVVVPRGNSMQITRVDVPEAARGQGVATDLHKAAADDALASNKLLISDTDVTPGGQGPWRKLAEQGYDVDFHPDAVDGEHFTSPDGRPFAVLKGGPEPSADIMDLSKSAEAPNAPELKALDDKYQPEAEPKPEGAPEERPAPSIKGLSQSFSDAVQGQAALEAPAAKAAVKEARASLQNYGVKQLLAKNAKMMKSETGIEGQVPIRLADGRGVETTGLSLAPAYEERGFNTCPNSASCKTSCLGKTSGGNFMFGGGSDLDAMKGPRLAHYNNTQAMINDPKSFAIALNDEISKAEAKAAANGNKLGVRLNVLSDLHPKVYESIIKAHPDVDFYDYTKNASNPIAPNHHLTYSSTGVSQPAGINGTMMSEDIKGADGNVIAKGAPTGVNNPNQNWSRMRNRLDNGQNVAMSFSSKGKAGDANLPQTLHDLETGKQYRVVDGDTHDYRPMDAQAPGSPGVIVGLRNKAGTTKASTAASKSNGFFVHWSKDQGPVVKIAPQGKAKAALNNDLAVDHE